jgi:serine/threonine protein phosphatase 1
LPAHIIAYAVGDVHGRLDLLEGAIAEIERGAQAASADRVVAVFLGDYIDRGPESRGVIERLIALQEAKPCETVFLRGNHEQFLLDMIDERARGTAWLDYGGVETLRSYGVDASVIGARDLDRLGAAMRKAMPAEHVRFLRSTRLFDERGDYLFVHAGLRPDRLLSEQSDADMLWFRYYGDDEPVHGKTVVHGHTPNQRPGLGRWRINIDTGAYESDALTTLRLEGTDARFLKIDLAPNGGGPRVSDWGREVERATVAPSETGYERPAPQPPTPRAQKPAAPPKPRQTPARLGQRTRSGLMAAGAVAVAAVVVAVVLVGMFWLFQGRPQAAGQPPATQAALAAPPPGAPAAPSSNPLPQATTVAVASGAKHAPKASAATGATTNTVVPTEVAASPPPTTIAAPPPAAVAVVSPPPTTPSANADAPVSHGAPSGDAPIAAAPPSPSP